MKKISIALVLTAISLLINACGSSGGGSTGKVIKSAPIGNLTVSLSNADGVLRKGPQDIFLTFTDAAGKPVDVGAVSFNNFMPAMGTMPAMNHAATLTTTGTPGSYRGKLDIDATGEWQAQIAFEGAAGKGKTSFSITVQ